MNSAYTQEDPRPADGIPGARATRRRSEHFGAGIDVGCRCSSAHERSTTQKGSHAQPHSHQGVACAVADAAGGFGSARRCGNRNRDRGRPGECESDRVRAGEAQPRGLRVTGTNAGERIALRLQAGEPGILQVDVNDDGSADFSFERTDIRRITVDGRAGDDVVRIDESNGVFTDTIPTTILGGRGNDNLAGGSGTETLRGGPGTDRIDGNRGNDVAFMGSGDDTFVWDPGDGSDVVEGRSGADTMLFNGAAVAEQVDVSANGNRLTFFRNPGNITMDTAGVERVDFNALAGTDSSPSTT